MPNYMGQNIQAGPYGADQMEIQRRQRLAQLLQQQSMEPIQAPQGGAFAAPISPLQVAAKMYGGYQAGQIGNQADEKQKALAERMQSERQAALAKALSQAGGSPQPDAALGGGPAMPPDPVGAMGTLAQAQDPMTMQMGAPAINMQQQQMRQQQEQQFRAQQAQEAQRARAQESQLARESREAQALESREARAADVATRREDQADRAQQQMGLRREMEAGRRADRTATVSDNKAFREAQVIAKEDEAFRESRSSLDNATNNLDRLKAEAQKIKDHAGIGRITGIVGAFPDIPGSDAANARALLTTLKSQVGFSVLQAMRDASKTGGALGQVSNIENVLLQNNLAALETSQDVGQMKASLDQIIKYTDDAKKRLTQGFRDSFPKRTPQTRATDKPAGALTPQEQQELDALRQRFGR